MPSLPNPAPQTLGAFSVLLLILLPMVLRFHVYGELWVQPHAQLVLICDQTDGNHSWFLLGSSVNLAIFCLALALVLVSRSHALIVHTTPGELSHLPRAQQCGNAFYVVYHYLCVEDSPLPQEPWMYWWKWKHPLLSTVPPSLFKMKFYFSLQHSAMIWCVVYLCWFILCVPPLKCNPQENRKF